MRRRELGIQLVRVREGLSHTAMVVAGGVLFPSGRVVLEWAISNKMEVWNSLEQAEQANRDEGRVVETIKI